jgi:hypothetical protein
MSNTKILVFSPDVSPNLIVQVFLPNKGDQRALVSGFYARLEDLELTAKRNNIGGRSIVIKKVRVYEHFIKSVSTFM